MTARLIPIIMYSNKKGHTVTHRRAMYTRKRKKKKRNSITYYEKRCVPIGLLFCVSLYLDASSTKQMMSNETNPAYSVFLANPKIVCLQCKWILVPRTVASTHSIHAYVVYLNALVLLQVYTFNSCVRSLFERQLLPVV